MTGRFGVVLAKEAEAWQKLLLPIKLFVGGPLGSGQQWFPWIDADDLARAILFLVEISTAEGSTTLPRRTGAAAYTDPASSGQTFTPALRSGSGSCPPYCARRSRRRAHSGERKGTSNKTGERRLYVQTPDGAEELNKLL